MRGKNAMTKKHTPDESLPLYEALHLLRRIGNVYTSYLCSLAEGMKLDGITAADLDELKETFRLFAFDVLGLKEERGSDSGREEAFGKVVDMLLEQRQAAKAAKDWATSDKIRNELQALGFEIKDGKEGATWKLNR